MELRLFDIDSCEHNTDNINYDIICDMTVGYHVHRPPSTHPYKMKKMKETNASEKNQKVQQTNSRAVTLKISGTRVPIQQVFEFMNI